MSDGAHLGVTAGRALETILGGKESPGDDELNPSGEVERRVRAAPRPLEGQPIHERDLGDDAYSLATDAIAHAILLVLDDDPTLLDRELRYDEAFFEAHPHAGWETKAALLGKPRDPTDALWDAVTGRWPEFDDWVGGATGFQVGFACNAARFARDRGPVSNPAIVEMALTTRFERRASRS